MESSAQDRVQVLNRGFVEVKIRQHGKIVRKKIEYRQTNRMIWQICRTYQGGWTDFANELTPEKKVRQMIKKEYDMRY